MNEARRDPVFRAAPSVRWSAGQGGIAVIDEAAGGSESLDPETAVVWELLAQERPREEIVGLASAIFGLDPESARERIAGLTARWLEVRWIEPVPPRRPDPQPWPTCP